MPVLVVAIVKPTTGRARPNSSPLFRLPVSLAGECSEFSIDFLCEGPFVTTVGATTGAKEEVAANFSGGGFSNYFAIPDYQTGAVAGFLKALGSTNKGQFK
jgi:tripeptidyl-peptidase I